MNKVYLYIGDGKVNEAFAVRDSSTDSVERNSQVAAYGDKETGGLDNVTEKQKLNSKSYEIGFSNSNGTDSIPRYTENDNSRGMNKHNFLKKVGNSHEHFSYQSNDENGTLKPKDISRKEIAKQVNQDGNDKESLHENIEFHCRKVGLNIQPPLKISLYQDWYDALLHNNVKSAVTLLNCVTESEKQILINGPFDYEESDDDRYFESRKWRLYLPFHIALMSCAEDLTSLLLEERVDLFATDHRKYNVLQACISIAFVYPKFEDHVCNKIDSLFQKLPFSDVCKLLAQENLDGLRPLEFAAQQGCLKVMKYLLATRNELTITYVKGCTERFYYDVSAYETGDRQNKNPINMLPFLDSDHFEKTDYRDIILSPLLMFWINAKIKSNAPLVFVWIFTRLMFYLVFTVTDSDISYQKSLYGNQSDIFICSALSLIDLSYNNKILLYSIILAYVTMALVLDFIETCFTFCGRHKLKLRNLNGCKSVVPNTLFYCISTFLVEILIFFNFAVYLLFTTGLFEQNSTFVTVLNLTRALVPVLMMWPVMYFFQLVPYIASSVVAIQEMYIELLRFLFLYILISLPFIHAYQMFFLTNSKTGCIEDFSNFFISLYSLFRIMLNDYGVSDLQVNEKVSLQILHVLYIATVAILVLNFLIAIMSSKANQIATNAKVYLKLNQLAIIVRFEDRSYWFLKSIYKRLRKLGFVIKQDKVYIVSEAMRLMMPKIMNEH